MLKEAVAYYHQLLKDFELAESSRRRWTKVWKEQN